MRPMRRETVRRARRWAPAGVLLLVLHAITMPAAFARDADVTASWRSDLVAVRGDEVDAGVEHVGQLDVAVEGEIEGLFGRPLSWTVSGFLNDGGSITRRVGDLQIVSNIEIARSTARWNEVRVVQSLGSDSSLLLGRYDVNAEFDVLDSAVHFVNSAFGIGTDIGQSGLNGPSIFPATGLALRYARALDEQSTLRLALVDGYPGGPSRERLTLSTAEGALMIAELERRGRDSKLLAGYWRYTGAFESQCTAIGCGDEDRNEGWYLRGEGAIASGANGAALRGFFRLGTAAGQYNVFDRFWSIGLLLECPLPGRCADTVGIAWAGGRAAHERRIALRGDGLDPADGEAVLEFSWRARLAPRVLVQPMIQIVEAPGTLERPERVFVTGARVEVQLGPLRKD